MNDKDETVLKLTSKIKGFFAGLLALIKVMLNSLAIGLAWMVVSIVIILTYMVAAGHIDLIVIGDGLEFWSI